jgi:hypothetical protein
VLGYLEAAIDHAHIEWPVITGPCPHCSSLHLWLAEWGAAINSACWAGENAARPAESYVPQVQP